MSKEQNSGSGAGHSMTRRSFLKMSSTAAAAAAAMDPLGLQEAVGAMTGRDKPNIVFVFSDEHRWCSLPFAEMPQVKTPNMERLADEGTRFDNCVSNSPICVPYRGMLITGQWPHQSSCVSNDYFGNGDVVGLDSPTIAHTFKDNGYVTGYVGKWHLKNYTVYNAGFDYFKHWLFGDDHWDTQVRDVPSREQFKSVKGYNAIGMTDQAIDFIEQNAGGDKPFMLMLSINPPHWRWDDAPEEFLEMYPPDEMDYRPNVEEKYKKSEKERVFYRHYHAHISAIDVQIGRLLDTLKEHNIDDNTVFIYTSDHGSSFGSNGVGSKANPYEEALRVPFIVRWPGKVAAGKIARNNIGAIDMYPTLCGLAGIETPKTCGGLDFAPAVLGSAEVDQKTQFILVNNFQRNYQRSRLDLDYNYFYPFRGVRSDRYTYTVYADGEWMLYDNINDPFQMKNLVNDPAHAAVKAELAAELDKWIKKAEDPFIPQQWRVSDVSKRVAMQNEHYSIIPFKKKWDQIKSEAVARNSSGVSDAGAKARLAKLADEVYDKSFFGMYLTLDNEISGRRKHLKKPEDQAKADLAEFKRGYDERFDKQAKEILN